MSDDSSSFSLKEEYEKYLKENKGEGSSSVSLDEDLQEYLREARSKHEKKSKEPALWWLNQSEEEEDGGADNLNDWLRPSGQKAPTGVAARRPPKLEELLEPSPEVEQTKMKLKEWLKPKPEGEDIEKKLEEWLRPKTEEEKLKEQEDWLKLLQAEATGRPQAQKPSRSATPEQAYSSEFDEESSSKSYAPRVKKLWELESDGDKVGEEVQSSVSQDDRLTPSKHSGAPSNANDGSGDKSSRTTASSPSSTPKNSVDEDPPVSQSNRGSRNSAAEPKQAPPPPEPAERKTSPGDQDKLIDIVLQTKLEDLAKISKNNGTDRTKLRQSDPQFPLKDFHRDLPQTLVQQLDQQFQEKELPATRDFYPSSSSASPKDDKVVFLDAKTKKMLVQQASQHSITPVAEPQSKPPSPKPPIGTKPFTKPSNKPLSKFTPPRRQQPPKSAPQKQQKAPPPNKKAPYPSKNLPPTRKPSRAATAPVSRRPPAAKLGLKPTNLASKDAGDFLTDPSLLSHKFAPEDPGSVLSSSLSAAIHQLPPALLLTLPRLPPDQAPQVMEAAGLTRPEENTVEAPRSQRSLPGDDREIQEKLIQGYQIENEKLYAELKELQKKSKADMKHLESHNQQLAQDLAKLREQLELESRIQEYHSFHSNPENDPEFLKLKEDNERLKIEVESLRQEKTLLEERCSQLQTDSSQMTSEILTLTRTQEYYSKKIQELTEQASVPGNLLSPTTVHFLEEQVQVLQSQLEQQEETADLRLSAVQTQLTTIKVDYERKLAEMAATMQHYSAPPSRHFAEASVQCAFTDENMAAPELRLKMEQLRLQLETSEELHAQVFRKTEQEMEQLRANYRAELHKISPKVAQLTSQLETQQIITTQLEEQLKEALQYQARYQRQHQINNQLLLRLSKLQEKLESLSNPEKSLLQLQESVKLLEQRALLREEEVQKLVEQTRQTFDTSHLRQELVQWRAKVIEKNRQIEAFRSELDAILQFLNHLKSLGIQVPTTSAS